MNLDKLEATAKAAQHAFTDGVDEDELVMAQGVFATEFTPEVVLKLLHIVRLSAEYESADAGAMSHESDAAYLKWRTAVRELFGR